MSASLDQARADGSDATETTHPLRAAVETAEAELEAAQAAREALDEDDGVDGAEPRYEAALDRETAAEEASAEAREALVDSDCPREWSVRDDGGEYWRGMATSGAEAIRLSDPTTDPADFDSPGSTIWCDVFAFCEETGEEATDTFRVDPDEPECDGSADHDWQSPIELLGGVEANPGVWGSGGGVVIHEACIRCGCRKTVDTWAQRPDTGEQGLTSVEYEEGCYDVSAYSARVEGLT